MTVTTRVIVTLTMNPAVDVSASVDYVVPGDKLRCSPPAYEPGGGGINVARAIRRLGGEALAVFPAGGPAGALLGRLLDGEGVAYRALPIEAWTRENTNVLERVTGRQFRFVMPGPRLTEADWRRVLAELGALDPPPEFLVVSGSLPPGVPPKFYVSVADTMPSGTRLVVDGSGPALRHVVERGVYLLKPSLREFEELTGERGCEESRLPVLARRLIDERACELLVLSLGAGGVLWMSASDGGRITAPAVPVRSNVGAGDSMVAGIVLALASRRPLEDAVRFGVAAGAASVMNPGTELCRPGDVERLYRAMTGAPATSAT